MKILVVSSYLPFPLDSGGHVRLYNILKELSKNHKITLICEKRTYQTQKDIDVLKAFCEEILTVERKKQWSLQNVQKSAMSLYPFLMVGHTLSEMKKRIVAALAQTRFDVIHVETFYVMQNLPKTYLPVVLVEHNIEYMVYQRYANTASVFIKPLLLADIAKIKYWEEKYWKQVTKVVAVSHEEKEVMKQVDAAVVPNGVDTKKFSFTKPKKKKGKRILFIGNFKWVQNQKAVQKILDDLWPKLLQLLQDEKAIIPTLWIVGKNIPDTIKAYQSKHILIDENAPDATEKIYQKADILLAPIEVGGGSSYKILEAMASGVPVVTTELGAKGIAATAAIHVLVGENDDELVEHVFDLLETPEKFEKMRLSARKFVEETYNWEQITKSLEKVYIDAMSETI